ncbi:MAG: hypothetical protein QOD74_1250 [Variibacter sp.]|nr:hypothetical protein [Variibacter sp.]
MPEGTARPGMLDHLVGFALRRLRALTVLLLLGGFGLILVHQASWTSIGFAMLLIAVLCFGWLSVWFWVWVFRNSGKPGRN